MMINHVLPVRTMSALGRFIGLPAGFKQSSRIGSIGLEFAREQLHMVQLQKLPGGQIRVHASASLSYPDEREVLLASPTKLRSILRRQLKSAHFHDTRVVAALPVPEVRIMSVAYQVNATQNNEQAILKQLSGRIEGGLADKVIDYLPVRDSAKDEERLAVVAVAKRDRVVAHLEMLRLAGLRVEALEIGPVAIKRLVTAFCEQGKYHNVLAINFGHHTSYLTMISGRRLLFDQQLDFGEKSLLQEVSMALDMDTESARELVYRYGLSPLYSQQQREGSAIDDKDVIDTLSEIVKPSLLALVDEIKRALIYAASETRGETVKKVYLLGSIARWNGVDKILNDLLDIPVANIKDPLSALAQGQILEYESHNALAPEVAVATGLALRGMAQDG
ncbi:MAG: pilus assembly protein PilM [Gammaproteobacteria bacterium]|nr:pilus assembly protein PilM [Gammaproteobacteria bacterium]